MNAQPQTPNKPEPQPDLADAADAEETELEKKDDPEQIADPDFDNAP